LIEVESLFAQFVDIRRLDLLLAIEAEVPRPQVVGHDEHDIGFIGSLRVIRCVKYGKQCYRGG
jgi:hypothetical protein